MLEAVAQLVVAPFYISGTIGRVLHIGQLPRVSREDPERIRVDSVFETFVCSLSVCSLFVSKFSHFPSFSLLFLYSTVQKSAVQYRYLFGASILQRSLMHCKVLANSLVYPERIHRGIEWTSVFETSVYLFTCQQIFSFSLFQPSLFIQYSTEECSTVQVFIWCLDTIAQFNVL